MDAKELIAQRIATFVADRASSLYEYARHGFLEGEALRRSYMTKEAILELVREELK